MLEGPCETYSEQVLRAKGTIRVICGTLLPRLAHPGYSPQCRSRPQCRAWNSRSLGGRLR